MPNPFRPPSYPRLTVRSPRPDVSTPPDTLTVGTTVRFPPMLHSANIEGEVGMHLLITVDGMVDLPHSNVVRASHPLFTESVQAAVQQWRFRAAKDGNRPVAVLLPLNVAFELPRDVWPARPVQRLTWDSAGLHLRLGWHLVPNVPSAAIDSAEIPAVTRLAFLGAFSVAGSGICVASGDLPRGELQSTVFDSLSARFPHLRNASQCPPTYASQIYRPDAPARPPGYKDPVWTRLGPARAWAPNLYVINGVQTQGTVGRGIRCVVSRESPDSEWEAVCELTYHSVA